MTSRDEIEVQALREARVHVVRGEPGQAVLQLVGARDAVYFAMSIESLGVLAARLTSDAKLLSSDADPARPS